MNPINALRRRTRAERRVLAMLRDEGTSGDHPCFAALSHWARQQGFVIHPPGTPHVSEDELRLLGWIAHAQRQDGGFGLPRDSHAIAIIQPCATLLASLSLRLSHFTMFSGQRLGLHAVKP